MSLSFLRLPSLLDVPLIRFGLVGLVNISVDLFGFLLLVSVFGFAAPISNVMAFSAAIVTSYTLNSRWTFSCWHGEQQHSRRFAIFFLVNMVGLALSTTLVVSFLMVMNELFAKVLSIPFVFCWNYIASKHFVFHARDMAGLPTIAESHQSSR